MFSEFKILCDENIHPNVVDYLTSQGLDFESIWGLVLRGLDEEDVLVRAYSENRLVLTHDSDFGTLVIADQKPFFGIVHLKSGHILPKFTLESLDALLQSKIDVEPPFSVIPARTWSRFLL